MTNETTNGTSNTRRIYLIVISAITAVVFLISIAVALSAAVSLINPTNVTYPQTIADYRERYARWEDGQKVGYEFSEDELQTMFEEERALNLKVQKTSTTNTLIVSLLLVILSGGIWLAHGKQLKA